MFWRKKNTSITSKAEAVPAATEDDIRYCFRLLLGRKVNTEEWAGHRLQAGRELSGVVAGYVNSLEFARRGLQDQDHMGQVVLCELDGFRIYAAGDDAAVGRHVKAGIYEPEVTKVFRRHLRPGMSVIDIGANIGYFTMLSATLVGPSGYVLAIEPNSYNARLLEASRRINGFDHVTLAQVAGGTGIGLLVLHRSHSNGTTTVPPNELNALLGSESVACLPIDRLVPANRPVDLIKIDVEGAEYTALRGCEATLRRCRPRLISEFSPDMMPGISGIDPVDYLKWLESLGYALSAIEKDGSVSAPGGPAHIMSVYEARGTDHIDIMGVAFDAPVL